MSKLQFRARTLDASKPMPIYLAEELPDLTDYSAINRAVPQMPSGMEKEEECEHHLQRAICTGLIIPTPEVTDMADAEAYDKIYPANYKQPRQLIHMQPFAMEQDIPDYDMDSEDEAWVEEQARRLDVTPLKFEAMMDRLEKSSGQTVVTLHDAKALLKEDDDLIIAIFDYWLNKRLKTQHPLILAVKTEHRMGSAANNPYLAFRRRTEKMQTRKNRKNDETSYEKMLKLRRDLSRAVTLLELVKRREKTKREHLHLTIEIAEKRYQAQDFNGALLAEVSALKTARPAFAPLFTNQFSNQNWVNKSGLKIDEIIPRKEKRQYKKRKHKTAAHCNRSMMAGPGLEPMLSSDEEDLTSAGTMLASPEEPETPDPDEGRYAFRRNKNCSYHMPITKEMGNWPWYSRNENGTADPRYRYTLTSISHPKPRCIGFARRRLGRGGRVILDRASTAYDDIWRNLDYTITDTPSLREKLACERLFKESAKKTCLQDDNEMSVDMRMLPPCSRTIETDAVESSPVQNVTPAGLRNLYTEHNYNLTSPSSCSGYMPQNYRLKDEADLSSDSLSGLGTSRRNLNQSFYNSVSVKSEPHNWTSGFVTDVQIKQEVDEQLVSERLNDCINKSDFASNSSVPAFENKIVRNSDETLVGVDSNCSQAVLEFLQEVKKDWLHFRPKTPPQGYEPPCHLLASEDEIFNPTNFTPIRIEIENLLSTPPSALVDTSTYTSEITLNDLYTDLNLDSQLLELSSDDMVCHSSFTLGLSSNTTLRDSRLEIDSNSDKDTDKIINDARSTSTKVASTLNEKLDVSGNDSQFGCSRVTFSSKESVESKKTTHGDRSPVEKISISGIYSTERCIISNSTSTASISTDSIRAKRYGMQHTTPQKKQTHTSISSSILSNTLTSPNKYNSVLNSSTAITPVLLDRVTNRSLTSGSVRITSIVNHHHLWTSGNDTPVHTNGPIAPVSRDETASSVTRRSNNKQLLHRSALDEDTNDEGAVLTETKLWSNTVYRLPNNSNANPQTRHLSLGTNTQTTHTLNSNSANNLESASPSLGDAIDSSTVRTKLPASSLQQQTSHFSNNMENNSAVTSTVPSGKQPNNKQQIMRKNNTLAMEVT